MKVLDYRISHEDHQNNKDKSTFCCYCGEVLQLARSGKQKTVDHLIPVSKGGSNKQLNKRNCCAHCNSQKDNMFPQQYLDYIKSLPDTYHNKIKVENIEHIIHYVSEHGRVLFKNEGSFKYFKRRFLKTTS